MLKPKFIKTIVITLLGFVMFSTPMLNVSGSTVNPSAHQFQPVTVILMGKPPYKISGKRGIGSLSKRLVKAINAASQSDVKQLKHEIHHLKSLLGI